MFAGHANTKPRAVVFDLGRVFLEFDYLKGARRIAARARIPADEIVRLISTHPAMIAYETGRIRTDEFFQVMQQLTGFNGSAEEFFAFFTEVFTPVEEMIEFNDRLRARGVRTYILSNTNEVTVQYIRRTYPFFARFDGYVFSHEQGVMKPEAAIYRAVEQLTGLSGPALFYVDDLPANVQAARTLGWQAFVHESPEKTIAIARSLGLPG